MDQMIRDFDTELLDRDGFEGALQTQIKLARLQQDHPLRMILSKPGTMGIKGREGLSEEVDSNPAVRKAMACLVTARDRGAEEMMVEYGQMIRILANIIRYERLTGKYKPDDLVWLERAASIWYMRRGVMMQWLPNRTKPYQQPERPNSVPE